MIFSDHFIAIGHPNNPVQQGLPDLGFKKYLKLTRAVPDGISDVLQDGVIKIDDWGKLPKSGRMWQRVSFLPCWWQQEDSKSCGLFTFLGFLYFMRETHVDIHSISRMVGLSSSMDDVRELMVGIQSCFFNSISEGKEDYDLTNQYDVSMGQYRGPADDPKDQ